MTQIKNINGPETEPCGTQHDIFLKSESWFSISMKNIRSQRYDQNHLIHWSKKPIASRFFIKISLFIVSKAFCRSIKIIPVSSKSSSKPFRTLSVKKDRHSLVK